MSNKPEIKFHIEDSLIIHSGSGMVQEKKDIVEMLEHYFVVTDQNKKLEKKLDDFRSVNNMLRKKQVEAQREVAKLSPVMKEQAWIIDQVKLGVNMGASLCIDNGSFIHDELKRISELSGTVGGE